MRERISRTWRRLSHSRQGAIASVVIYIVLWFVDKGLTLFYQKTLERTHSWDDWGVLMGVLNDIVSDRLVIGFVIAAAIFGLGPFFASVPRQLREAGLLAVERRTFSQDGAIQDNELHTDYDVVAKRLSVRATKTDDGIDIAPIIFYRNRSTRTLYFKNAKVTYFLNGKTPDGAASHGLTSPIKKGQDSHVKFRPVRIYNDDGRAKGEVSLQLTYGENRESARTRVLIKYEFETLSAPNKKGAEEEVEAKASGGATYQVLHPDQSDEK